MTLLERYGWPPDEIERESRRRLRAAVGDRLPRDPFTRAVVERMLYAVGDPGLISNVVVHPGGCEAGVAALRAGAPIIVDVAMVAAAVQRRALARVETTIEVAVEVAGVQQRAVTRAAAGMQVLADRLAGSVVAIGNAPTALLALLDLLDTGARPPAFIVGVPVGLVAAAESKRELAARSIPFITVLGPRGGSALAAAALNALLGIIAAEDAGGAATLAFTRA